MSAAVANVWLSKPGVQVLLPPPVPVVTPVLDAPAVLPDPDDDVADVDPPVPAGVVSLLLLQADSNAAKENPPTTNPKNDFDLMTPPSPKRARLLQCRRPAK